MRNAYTWTIHRMPWLLFGTLIGCAEWPRYKHTSAINHETLSPDQTPREGVKLEWTDIPAPEEPNDTPSDPFPIKIGEGLSSQGVLSGLGWSADEQPNRVSACGETRAFPPAAPGNYTGDVDWFTIKTEQPGTLCLQLNTDLELDVARLDAALYVLDECNEPVSVFVHPETEIPIGTNLPSNQAQWTISVDGGLSLGIGLAGFWPDDDELETEWTMRLAFVPSVAGAGSSLCPETP
jgi:hypothetical protein